MHQSANRIAIQLCPTCQRVERAGRQTDDERWRESGRALLDAVLHEARAGKLPEVAVYRVEQRRGRKLVTPTGQHVLLVSEQARLATLRGEKDEFLYGIALSPNLDEIVRGEMRYMRTYCVRSGLIWRVHQSWSESEYQSRSPGSEAALPDTDVPTASSSPEELRSVNSLRDLFVSSRAARQHPTLAALAGFEPKLDP